LRIQKLCFIWGAAKNDIFVTRKVVGLHFWH
jgi:hypothetical protein